MTAVKIWSFRTRQQSRQPPITLLHFKKAYSNEERLWEYANLTVNIHIHTHIYIQRLASIRAEWDLLPTTQLNRSDAIIGN